MPELHETRMGQQFYEGTMKQIAQSLNASVEQQTKTNKILEEKLLKRKKNETDLDQFLETYDINDEIMIYCLKIGLQTIYDNGSKKIQKDYEKVKEDINYLYNKQLNQNK